MLETGPNAAEKQRQVPRQQGCTRCGNNQCRLEQEGKEWSEGGFQNLKNQTDRLSEVFEQLQKH